MTETKKGGMWRALGDLLTRAGIAGRLGKTFQGERDL